MSEPADPAPRSGEAGRGDEPIRYIERTREYYRALGFEPYRWAHSAEIPFAALGRPLAKATVGLVTTAAPYQPELAVPGADNQGPGAPYNAAAKFHSVYSLQATSFPDLRISHLGYDRAHTSAADPDTYFPLARLLEAARAGRIGRVAPRFHGVPTTRSQRTTGEVDAPEVLRRLREDVADVAILVPT